MNSVPFGGPAFDHLDLDDMSRQLITAAIGGSPRVFLAPLDKGLSGATVWRARWELVDSGELSALHVFKIGPRRKLSQEVAAIEGIAAAIDPETTYVRLIDSVGDDVALLRQTFVGQNPDTVLSLREFLRNCDLPGGVEAVNDLYTRRMARWHVSVHGRTVNVPYSDALDWWISRADLPTAADQLSRNAVEMSLRSRYDTSVDGLVEFVERIMGETSSFVVGPVHGDLHAQNVLVDEDRRLHLIDFGWCAERWRAIDFLMLECSIKFVVTPRYARLGDLLRLEAWVEESDVSDNWSAFEETPLYGPRLAVLASCIVQIRRLALSLGACSDIDQYRRGLALLTAGLTSMPYRINHPFMLHSLAALRVRLNGS